MPEHSRIILGVITGVHGIQGEVKLKSFTGDPEAIASYGPLDASNGTTLKIKSLKAHKDFFRARLEGIDDRNAAEALKGLELSIARDRLPEPEADEVYHADLIGLCVQDTKRRGNRDGGRCCGLRRRRTARTEAAGHQIHRADAVQPANRAGHRSRVRHAEHRPSRRPAGRRC